MQARLTRRAFLARASAAATGLVILGFGFRCGPSPAGKVAETGAEETSLAGKAVEETMVSEATKEVTEVVEELAGKVTKEPTGSGVTKQATEVIEEPTEEVTTETIVSEVTEEVTEAAEGPPERLVGDADTCLACRECEVACSLYHEGKCNPALSRIEVDFDDFTAGFPEISVSAKCDLCEDRPQGPVCVEVCPARALTVVTA